MAAVEDPVAFEDTVAVEDLGTELRFSYQDLLRYSGPHSPAGVAVAFQAMRAAFPLLSPGSLVERREVFVATAFRGPGGRDGFELVTRCVTGGRYDVTAALERPDRGPTLDQFVFRLAYRASACTLVVAEGMVADDFIAMARRDDRSAEDEVRFAQMKRDGAVTLLSHDPSSVFEVVAG